MIAVATILAAVVATLACRVGHVLGARNDNAVNALRVVGGTLLFAMAIGAVAEGMALAGVTAGLCGLFVAIGGVDILRGELRGERAHRTAPDIRAPHAEIEMVRDGDTMEMPVIIRDVA